MIGPPGSGKSTLAAILAPLLPARVIANDVLREQLWGDANVQGPWSEVEPHLHGAIDRAIADGDNVLVDATHAQLNWRQRCVPEAVIRAMHMTLSQPPNRPDLSEGFASLIRLNPAGSQLSDQINRALQAILDPLP